MAKKPKKIAWFSPMILGLALGIFSQRIPDLKSYTDELMAPIENNALWREFKSKVGWPKPDQAFTYSHYREDSELPHHPISTFIIHRSEYSLGYDAKTRNPAWVYEHLTAEKIKGTEDRAH